MGVSNSFILLAIFDSSGGVITLAQPIRRSQTDMSIGDFFEHRTGGYDRTSFRIYSERSKMPGVTREALEQIMRSPLGSMIASRVKNAGSRIQLVLTKDADWWFTVPLPGDPIFYTTDIHAYLSNLDAIPGDGRQDGTLASYLSHEIGHVLHPNTDPGIRALIESEIRAVQNFENVFRDYAGLNRRCSYFEENDVCN
jgi:hypothetical protein